MKILLFDFGAYTLPDIEACFRKKNIEYRLVTYHFGNKNEDDFFIYRFQRFLEEESYDAVFSVNFFPLVAECCYKKAIKYISWSYDNPLNVVEIEKTLGYETNYVFLFDRVQVERYQRAGFHNVYHMPLAVNTNRLDQIRMTKEEQSRYRAQVGFVGKLYDSPLQEYMALMDDYLKGYLEAVCQSQFNLYGCYLVDDLLSDAVIEQINQGFLTRNPDTKFRMTREALSYACAAQVTRRERVTLLALLSARHDVKIYSREDNEMLSKAHFMGSVGYLREMPKVFKASDINLNINLKISQSGMPLRVLDILGAGGFLLSSYQPEVAEYFDDGQEVVLYQSIEDAVEKAQFYLANDVIRKKIAENGYRKVKEHFSYENQIEKIWKIAKMS